MEKDADGASSVGAARLRLADLNSHLICVLCRGYLVDATTIVECLHSFCRSCLVRHLERGVAACPKCEAPLPKARPFLHIRSDKTLQDIVYKLVPGLYRAEMQRRRHFFSKHPEQAALASAEERGESMERLVFSPEDHFSLSLEYFVPQAEKDIRSAEDWESVSNGCAAAESEAAAVPAEGGAASQAGPAKRYLQCPALFTVRLLKKFLRLKFDLGVKHKVDVMHRKVCLPDDYTLMDVAYIYSWRQSSPMRFFYRIYNDEEEIRSAKKRPHVVHEPVLDETSPPVKLERIEEESCEKLVSAAARVSEPPKDKSPGPSPPATLAVIEPSLPVLEPSLPVLEPPAATSTNVAAEQQDASVKSSEPSSSPPPPPASEIKKPAPEVPKSVDVTITPATKPATDATNAVVTSTSTPSVSVTVTPIVTSPTSPSKAARPRPTGVSRNGQAAPSILSIAQNLARKQQEQQKARQQQEKINELIITTIPNKPATMHAVQENKDKYKPIQPKPTSSPIDIKSKQQLPPAQQGQKRSHPITTAAACANKLTSPRVSSSGPPEQAVKAAAKKPKASEDILRQTLSKAKSPPTSSAARTRPSPTTYNNNNNNNNSPTMSPFAPMHRPHPHPIRIPAPPKQQQRPSSLSSTSSPSPSPPADAPARAAHHLDSRLFGSPQGNAAAAAMFVRQQLELQSRFLHSPEWAHHLHPAFLPSPTDWLSSTESMKRLEGLMRSLGRAAGTGSSPSLFPFRPNATTPASLAAHPQGSAK